MLLCEMCCEREGEVHDHKNALICYTCAEEITLERIKIEQKEAKEVEHSQANGSRNL